MKKTNRTAITWTLVNREYKKINPGQVLRTCTGNKCTLLYGEPPNNFKSSGRIFVKIEGEDTQRSYNPVVCDLKWIIER